METVWHVEVVVCVLLGIGTWMILMACRAVRLARQSLEIGVGSKFM